MVKLAILRQVGFVTRLALILLWSPIRLPIRIKDKDAHINEIRPYGAPCDIANQGSRTYGICRHANLRCSLIIVVMLLS